MSYDIGEGIEDHREVTESLREIQEFDPGTYRSNGRWVSSKLSAADCEDFEVHNGEKCGPFVRFYKIFGAVRLYPAGLKGEETLSYIFHQLRNQDPIKYRNLMETFRSQTWVEPV